MPTFQYSPEIIKEFPQIVGGIIIAQGMSNPPTSDALRRSPQPSRKQ